jgi:hypothetical protein
MDAVYVHALILDKLEQIEKRVVTLEASADRGKTVVKPGLAE